jgi:hypothetical protein
MKAGDLVRHNGKTTALWLLLEVPEDLAGQSILVVSVKTGYKMWANSRGFEVVSKCQENVKTSPSTLQSDSERVTL